MSESGGVQLNTSRSLLSCVRLSLPCAFPVAALPVGGGRVGIGRWAVNGDANNETPSRTPRTERTTEIHRQGVGTDRLTRPRQQSAVHDDG